MSIAETLTTYSFCAFHTFGAGFFLLTNVFYYASFCDGHISYPLTMFATVFMGACATAIADWAAFDAYRVSLSSPTPVRMVKTGLFYFMYCTLCMHLILVSMDTRFVLMATLAVCGFLLSLRYDFCDAIIVNILSILFGILVAVLETYVTSPHASVPDMQCSEPTAIAGLVAGGAWLALPAVNSIFFVFDFSHLSTTKRTKNTENIAHWIGPVLLIVITVIVAIVAGGWFLAPCMVIIAIILYSHNLSTTTTSDYTALASRCWIFCICVLVPVFSQAFYARQAWAPMLIVDTHISVLENIEGRAQTIFVIITQTILLIGSIAPAMWLLMFEVFRQVRNMNSRLLPRDSSTWIITIILMAAWAVFLLSLEFKAICYVYIGAAATLILTTPLFSAAQYVLG